MLTNLKPQPADKILALIQMFREDPRTDKIDLGVGVYKNAEGVTPVMRAIKAAEHQLWQTQTTKAYTGLAGDPAYGAALGELILGDSVDKARVAAAHEVVIDVRRVQHTAAVQRDACLAAEKGHRAWSNAGRAARGGHDRSSFGRRDPGEPAPVARGVGVGHHWRLEAGAVTARDGQHGGVGQGRGQRVGDVARAHRLGAVAHLNDYASLPIEPGRQPRLSR